MTKFTHPNDAPEGHQWQTREGHKVRIYATDGDGGYPIHGAWQTSVGLWFSESWTISGKNTGTISLDLQDVPPAPKTHTVWLNYYPNGWCASHATRVDADKVADPGRIACVLVTFAEGEGLDND